MNQPEPVSAIVIVKNGARFLAEALSSIQRQTLAPCETLVVDGGSTDGTAEIARSFPGVRYLLQPHMAASPMPTITASSRLRGKCSPFSPTMTCGRRKNLRCRWVIWQRIPSASMRFAAFIASVSRRMRPLRDFVPTGSPRNRSPISWRRSWRDGAFLLASACTGPTWLPEAIRTGLRASSMPAKPATPATRCCSTNACTAITAP